MLNKSQIITLIEELIIDNNTNLISPEYLRVCLEEIVDSDLNIIENQSLLGLANWDNTISYSINKTVVYDNNIYQALSTTTVGTFVEGEWNQISTFINQDLSDFLLKTNAIELDENKKVKNIALNTNYATFDTGFYFGQNNATFGLTETFPNTGNYILEIFKNVNSNFDIYKITYLTNLNKFYIKKNTDNWVAFEAGSVYTSSNGIEIIGNDFQIGGEFNVISLNGNSFDVSATNYVYFTAPLLAGSFDDIQLNSQTFKIGNEGIYGIEGDGINLEINASNINLNNDTNIHGELTITNKASYTTDPFLGGIDDLDIPTFKIVKDTALASSLGATFTNGLELISSGTAGYVVGLGGNLSKNTTIVGNNFDLTINDTNVLNLDANVLNVTTNFGINLTSGNPTSITVNDGPIFLTTENAPIIVDSPYYIIYNSTAGNTELYGEGYPLMLPHKTYVNDRIAEEVALKEDLIVKNPDSTPLVFTSSNGVASFQPLPVLGAQLYYLTPTSSDVASTYVQSLTPYPSSTSLNFTNIGTTQLLTTFITNLNEPNLTSIPAGTYISHLHIDKTLGNKTLQLNTEIWECSSSGIDIQLLASTGPTPIISITGTIQEFIISYSTIQKNISSTSRIKTKLYATISGTGSDIDLSLYFGANQDSNTSLPATSVSASNYLLLTGTQKGLDMGSFDITTNNLITSTATANTVPYFDSSKMLKSSTVSYTQLEYLNSLTSNVQTQLEYLNSSFIKKDGTTTTTAQIPFALGINSTTDSLINGLTVGKGAGNIATNTVLGAGSLITNTTGAHNVAIGVEALKFNLSGTANLAIGTTSLFLNTTGTYNLGIGWTSLGGNTTGNSNVGIGRYAGNGNETGSYNLCIGDNADVNFTNLTNAIAIGYNAKVNASNTVQVGNNNITNVKTQGTLTLNAVTYPNTHGTANQVLTTSGSGTLTWTTITAGSGTVTSVSVVSANGVSGTVATATTTPAITLTLGAITPSSVNKVTITAPTTSATLTLVDGSSLITSGAFSTTLTSTATTNVILPTTGTLSTLAGTETLTNKRVTPRTGTTTSSATPTINTDNVDFYSITAQTVDITSFTTNLTGTPTNGQKLWISITGTAARAITWGASFEASTIALPTTTVTTARLDVGFIWNTATSKWRCVGTC